MNLLIKKINFSILLDVKYKSVLYPTVLLFVK